MSIVGAILAKELKEAIRNRTLLLVVLLPLAASFGFRWLQTEGLPSLTVAVPAPSRDVFARALPADLVHLRVYGRHENPVERLAAESHWHGVIVPDPAFADSLVRGEPVGLRLILRPDLGPGERLAASQLPLLLQSLGSEPAVRVEVEGGGAGSFDGSLIAVWMTVTAVMIGVMVMGGNIAEERERGTLLALVTTPARLGEILGAKALFGTLITGAMGALMLVAHGASLPTAAAAFSVLAPGAFCFTAAGLLLGFLAPNQATARSYGTLLYLPLLVPVFAHGASPWITRWSPLFPSYHLWAGLEAAFRLQQGAAEAVSRVPWQTVSGAAPVMAHAGWLLGFSVLVGGLLAVTMVRRRF